MAEELEITIFPDDILVTLRKAQNIESRINGWIGSYVGIERVPPCWGFVNRALIYIACINALLFLKLPQYSVRCIRYFR